MSLDRKGARKQESIRRLLSLSNFLAVSLSGLLWGCAKQTYVTHSSPQITQKQIQQAREAELKVPTLTAEEVRRKQLLGEDFSFYDARSQEQYNLKHCKGALNLPWNEVGQRWREIPQDKDIIFYCGGSDCPVSAYAVKELMRLGYTRIGDMKGGIQEWEQKGYPTIKGGDK